MSDDETVLLVAVCAGSRCHGLRRLHAAEAGGTTDACGQVVRTAVRDRSDAVLVSTGCLGPCHQGSVAVVGAAVHRPPGRFDWLAPPHMLCMLDLPKRAAAAAELIRTLEVA